MDLIKPTLLCVALLTSIMVLSQEFSISGTVSANNEFLEGTNIFISKLKVGTITDSNGNFELNKVIKGTHTLSITYNGYQEQKLPVTITNSNINLGTIVLHEDHFHLHEVIISATRNEILRKDAPIICNLIDSEILDATQSVTLLESLSFQPALRIENNCQNCGFSGLRMNGLESAYSQVLIDGRPIFNSLQGVYGLEQIPSNMIERVEIIRSGGSALYGSSAVAGTVNVITKEPDTNNFYFNSNLAWINGEIPDQTYMIGGNLRNEDKTAGLSINAFNRTRTPWDANNDGFSEIGQIKSNTFQAKSYIEPSNLSKIIFNGFGIYELRRGGNRFDLPYHQADITEATTHNILNGGISYEQYTASRDHKFSTYFNYQTLKRDSYYGGGQDPNAYGNSSDKSLVGGLQYSGKLGEYLGGKHTLVSGMEYTSNDLRDNAPAYNRFIAQKANLLGFYVQDVWDIKDKFSILLGGRLDKHNLINDLILSPRINLMYKIKPELQFRIGYARGFRAPQVFDEDLHITQVGGEGTVVTNSNNLNPEYSNAYSTSLDYNKYFKDWSVGFSIDAFYTRLTDVFILEEVGNTTNGDLLLERHNGPGAKVLGINVNPKINYKNKLSLQLGYSIQKSEYDVPVQWSETVTNTNKQFFRTPNQYGFYVLTWGISENLNLNFSGVYTGSMIAQHYAGYITDDTLETTPSFFENNLKVEYKINLLKENKLSFSAGIQNYINAFQNDFDSGENRDAGYVYGPSRPRTYFAGLKADF